MSSWPATLPNMKLGTDIGDDESRLTTPMDAGPASVRNRFTAVTQTVNVPMVLTGTQLAAFNTFFRTTINHGTDSFTWTDPADGSSVTVRFKSKPRWQSISSGAAADRVWSGTLSLEILP